MPDEHDFTAAGRVSIWLGDFSDEMDALDFIESENGFGRQFGCVLRHRRELVTHEEPKPMRQLLEGFSSWQDFVDEAAALEPKEAVARCAVIAYACDYRLLSFTPRRARCVFWV